MPLDESSAELGARLLQRVGRNLVADSRAESGGHGPLLFYAVPKPFGETLCRVDVYTVAPKIVRGQKMKKEKWDDDLKVDTLYGLWKRPSAKGGDRDKACAAFRDFANLIAEGSVLSVERGAFVLEVILEHAKVGQFPYKVTCSIWSGEGSKACDPLTVLRNVSLEDLYRTEMKSELTKERSFVRRDELHVANDRIAKVLKSGKGVLTTIYVEDEQHFGKQAIDEADVLSVEIEISEFG